MHVQCVHRQCVCLHECVCVCVLFGVRMALVLDEKISNSSSGYLELQNRL